MALEESLSTSSIPPPTAKVIISHMHLLETGRSESQYRQNYSEASKNIGMRNKSKL